MEAYIKSKWVKALRSGRYKQIRHKLHTNKGNCCLGILCLIAASEGVCRFDPKDGTFDGFTQSLPQSVMDWAKLDVRDQNLITPLNDDHQLSFGDIADFIDRTF